MSLRRKDQFEDLLKGPNINLELPQRIASQILDSPYFTRFVGNDLSDAHDAKEDQRDQERVVERQAAQQNVPLAELRAIVDQMRPTPDLRPFEGQAAHEARQAQQELAARLEQQRVGLALFSRQQTTVQEAQAALQQTQGQTMASLAQQLQTTQRRYKRYFKARPESSSASEPGAEPSRGRSRP